MKPARNIYRAQRQTKGTSTTQLIINRSQLAYMNDRRKWECDDHFGSESLCVGSRERREYVGVEHNRRTVDVRATPTPQSSTRSSRQTDLWT